MLLGCSVDILRVLHVIDCQHNCTVQTILMQKINNKLHFFLRVHIEISCEGYGETMTMGLLNILSHYRHRQMGGYSSDRHNKIDP